MLFQSAQETERNDEMIRSTLHCSTLLARLRSHDCSRSMYLVMKIFHNLNALSKASHVKKKCNQYVGKCVRTKVMTSDYGCPLVNPAGRLGC